MVVINHGWASTGSSGGATNLEAVHLPSPPAYSVLMVEASTLASTQSFSFQVAQHSSGPWFTEASTSIAADANNAAQATLRVTGPYPWMRPRLNSASTGIYNVRLIGVI